MITVSVLYPRTDTSRFDMGYYLEQHMPMVKHRLGPACRSMTVDGGLAGGVPADPPPYAVMTHLKFDSVDTFNAAFGPHAREILGDIPNYTDVQPVIQISEVRL